MWNLCLLLQLLLQYISTHHFNELHNNLSSVWLSGSPVAPGWLKFAQATRYWLLTAWLGYEQTEDFFLLKFVWKSKMLATTTSTWVLWFWAMVAPSYYHSKIIKVHYSTDLICQILPYNQFKCHNIGIFTQSFLVSKSGYQQQNSGIQSPGLPGYY